jgi:SAM-dependent methyltransferase
MSRVLRQVIAGDWSQLLYAVSTRWQGLDLSGESLEQIGLCPDMAHMHAASGGPVLQKVIKALRIPSGQRVVDFGSGKGAAAITLSECGFAEVLGVEMSPRLVEIANANAVKSGSNARFLCANAADFKHLDRFSYFYFFNPFPAPVVRMVLGNIAASIQRKPRRTTLIMKWPDQGPDEILNGFPFRKVIEFHPRDSHPFYIYECDHGCNPVPPL